MSLLERLEELEKRACQGEWFAWFRTPQFEGDGGGVDISIRSNDPRHVGSEAGADGFDDWVIAEFASFGPRGKEGYANADAERQLAIAARNALPTLLAEIRRLERTLRWYAKKENWENQRDECEVCANTPDEHGFIQHGRGCYTQSEDGGGESYEGPPVLTDSGRFARMVLAEHERAMEEA